MDTQLITVKEFVANGRLALAEGRIQAQTSYNMGDGFLCLNLLADPLGKGRKFGCIVGVSLNDYNRQEHPSTSFLKLVEIEAVTARSSRASSAMDVAQIIHDAIVRGNPNEIAEVGSYTDLPSEMRNFKVEHSIVTIEHLKQWLDLMEKYETFLETA